MTTYTTVPNLGDWITEAPLRTARVSFLVTNSLGAIQAHTLEGKRALAASESGILYVLWTGRYHTDARQATYSERKALADALA